jgi:hypothetical protein
MRDIFSHPDWDSFAKAARFVRGVHMYGSLVGDGQIPASRFYTLQRYPAL